MDQHDLNDIARRIASAAAQFAPGYRPTPRRRRTPRRCCGT